MISNKLKLLLFVIVTFTVALLIFLVIRSRKTTSPTAPPTTPPPEQNMSSLEAHIKDRMQAMENTACDYTLNLSKSNRILWKKCHDGYDRYYIPENVWFKNNKPDQSPEDKDMCIGKAIQEVRSTHPEYSYDLNDKSETSLWVSEKCKK